MKRCALLVIVSVVIAVVATSQFSRHARRAPMRDMFVPVPTGDGPDRVILGWTGDPATTQAVTWRTLLPVQAPQAQIAPIEASRDFEAKAVSTPGRVTPVVVHGKTVYHYEADFEGLSPETRYLYRVGDGLDWSEWNEFRTAPVKPDHFRFIYLGDVQHDIASLCSRIIRAAYRFAPDARFILYGGDLTEAGGQDVLWGEWCFAQGFIPRTIPILSVLGDHDIARADDEPPTQDSTAAPALWRAHLALPLNGPKDVPLLQEETYFVDYESVRIVCLDSNVYEDEGAGEQERTRARDLQRAWLEETLEGAGDRWKIVVHHHPIFSVGRQRDNAELRKELEPIYDRYHVDLVLQGHDHHYGRTQKVRDGQVVGADEDGTIYAVSVCGPKSYDKNTKFESLMAVMRGNTQMFEIIDADEARLAYAAYSATGERVDAFELRKVPGKPTTCVPIVTPPTTP